MVGHRNCSVVGCSNSGAKLNKWREKVCPIHNCNNGTEECVCLPPFVLFPFPTLHRAPEKRKRWLKLIKRQDDKGKDWNPGSGARVCSAHFKDGCPTDSNPDPTLNLGHSQLSERRKARKAPCVRDQGLKIPPKKRKLTVVTSNDLNVDESNNCETITEHEPEIIIETLSSSTQTSNEEGNLKSRNVDAALIDHDYTNLIYYSTTAKEEVVCGKQKCKEAMEFYKKKVNSLYGIVDKLRKNAEHWKNMYMKKKSKPFSHKSLNTNNKIKTFTGIPNIACFNSLFTMLESKVPKITYWSGPKNLAVNTRRKFNSTPKKSGPTRKLHAKDEFLLTLMKLRLGSVNADLAERFNISTTTVSNILNTWIRFLAVQWRCLIHNPSKDIAMQHLPQKFRNQKYRNVRHIIDCTEIFIETPSNPKIKAATWSDYKHHQTLKVLLSIMPCGSFNFVSEAWGGRTSDVSITRDSGFYNLLEYGDEVMADRGFTIAEDLLIRHCRLHIPPGRRGQEQFNKADVKKTKEIANLRIFVEQAIRRLKTFRIIKNEVPVLLLDKIDDIVTICAALCNLYPKLCS